MYIYTKTENILRAPPPGVYSCSLVLLCSLLLVTTNNTNTNNNKCRKLTSCKRFSLGKRWMYLYDIFMRHIYIGTFYWPIYAVDKRFKKK